MTVHHMLHVFSKEVAVIAPLEPEGCTGSYAHLERGDSAA